MVMMNAVVQTRYGQYDVFSSTFALYTSLGQVIWNSLSHLKKSIWNYIGELWTWHSKCQEIDIIFIMELAHI